MKKNVFFGIFIILKNGFIMVCCMFFLIFNVYVINVCLGLICGMLLIDLMILIVCCVMF